MWSYWLTSLAQRCGAMGCLRICRESGVLRSVHGGAVQQRCEDGITPEDELVKHCADTTNPHVRFEIAARLLRDFVSLTSGAQSVVLSKDEIGHARHCECH